MSALRLELRVSSSGLFQRRSRTNPRLFLSLGGTIQELFFYRRYLDSCLLFYIDSTPLTLLFSDESSASGQSSSGGGGGCDHVSVASVSTLSNGGTNSTLQLRSFCATSAKSLEPELVDSKTNGTGAAALPPPVSLPVGAAAAASSEESNGGIVVITIFPDEKGRFGFNVKGGADQKLPIIVSRVGANTPADK